MVTVSVLLVSELRIFIGTTLPLASTAKDETSAPRRTRAFQTGLPVRPSTTAPRPSSAVASQSSDEEQAAAWLFIQWATSEAIARDYVEAGGVSGRTAIYEEPDIRETYMFVDPMVESWQAGVPEFRPRFPAWPELSDIIAEWGTRMMLGDVSIQEGAEEIGSRMEEILDAEGYYDGSRELLQ